MDISANTSKVKYKNDEEPLVTDIFLIKAPGYFKLFECGKEFFNNRTQHMNACAWKM